MIYHTNHCWCSSSNWDNKSFDGEVMVVLSEYINTDTIDSYTHKIIDPDFKKIVKEYKFFDQEGYDERMEMIKDENLDAKELKRVSELYNQNSNKKTVNLNDEVINWLNDNVKDKLNTNGKTPLESRKGWAIGNDSYNSKQSYELSIFFERQVDALKFIRKFSIFKDPTFYFDYFKSDRREMQPEKVLNIINENSDLNYKIENYNFIYDREEVYNTNLDPLTFKLMDWEKEDCIDMTEEDLKNALIEIMSVDEDESNFIDIN